MNQSILRTALLDDAYARLNQAAHAGAFGSNDRPLPAEAQLKAGNYPKGRTNLHGFRIAIEQPQGSIRSGVDANGKAWSCRMAAHYGYFEGTRGADGDGVDVFVGPYPESGAAFVINQANVGGGFDEHKVMLGFSDEDHARKAYLASYERGWRGLQSIVPLTLYQLRQWLKTGNKHVAVTPANLPPESKAMTKKVFWNGAVPSGQSFDQVLYDLRRDDGSEGLLLDSVTIAEILEDSDGVLAFDALVVEVAHVGRLSERLRLIMDRASATLKAPAVQVTDPFKARGVTNVAAVYELSDGQTVSVFFHNPDTTPNRLAPADELISWKWLLNKKDITIAVAPEKGQDLNPRIVASRIMKLAEKNSAAFQRANAKRAERLGSIQQARDRIAEKEETLKGLVSDIEVAQLERDKRTNDQRASNDATREAVKAWLLESGYELRDEAMGRFSKVIGERIMLVSAAMLQVVVNVLDAKKLSNGLVSTMTKEFQDALVPTADGMVQPAMNYAAGLEAIQAFVRGREAEGVQQKDAPRMDPLTPENYAKVLNDPALQLDYQDELDSYFQGRIIEVRNALRGLGWAGEKFEALTKNDAKLEIHTQRVGAGSNVVGVKYYVTGNVAQGGSDPTQDLPEFTALEIAQDIDTKVKKPVQEQEEAAQLPEGWSESAPGGMATNNDPEVGGIVDVNIASGKWFAVANKEGVGTLEGFDTRADALAALSAAVQGRKEAEQYLAITNVTDTRLSFALAGLDGLYAGEKAYFVANPKNPDEVASGVGYWSEKVASVRAKPTELLYSRDEVAAEMSRRSGGQEEAAPKLTKRGFISARRNAGSDSLLFEANFYAVDSEGRQVKSLNQEAIFPSEVEARKWLADLGANIREEVYKHVNVKGSQVSYELGEGAYAKQEATGEITFNNGIDTREMKFPSVDAFDAFMDKKVFEWPQIREKWLKDFDRANQNYKLMNHAELVSVAKEMGIYKFGDSAEKLLVKIVEAKNPTPAQEQEESEPDPITLVDAAYTFNGTEAFKRRVAGSIDKSDYSEFATAKAMDEKAKELGASIEWGMGAALDSVEPDEAEEEVEDDEDDFDPEAEFDSIPDEEVTA